MRQIVIITGLLLTQIALNSGAGHFYVGLLGYSMPEGEKCCEEGSTNVTCTQYCHLIFEVQLHGLNGSNDMFRYRLSTTPLSPAEAATFQTGQSAQITNPLTFNFVKWPGAVNVSVLVYDQARLDDPGSLLQVDEFTATFVRYMPENFYILRDLNASDSQSKLTIVFRYDCGATKGPECFTDCVDHGDNETCPMTSPNPLSPEVTFTGSFGKCETVDEQGVVVHTNCTAESTPKPTQNTTHTKYLDGGATQTPKPNSSTSTGASEVTSDDPKSTSTTLSTTTTKTTTPISTSTEDKTTTTSQTKTTTVRKSDDPRATVTSDPTKGSTPDERSTKNDEETTMKYWPAIVGGVLGGVAFIAAIGFCLYYRRQKKMRKRQEIYNVNPKVLRNFEEYAENGTSGRADVPLETEQY